jgi:hypothetical protein
MVSFAPKAGLGVYATLGKREGVVGGRIVGEEITVADGTELFDQLDADFLGFFRDRTRTGIVDPDSKSLQNAWGRYSAPLECE